MAQTDEGLVDRVVDGIRGAQAGEWSARCVYRACEVPSSRNQFCLFLKPWVTRPGTDFPALVALVAERIAAHSFFIEEVGILSGRLLAEQQLMLQHYGIFTRLAQDAASNMSESMRHEFFAIFGVDSREVLVLGGFEVLDRFPDISPFALEVLWENLEQHRLGSSAYCGRLRIGNEEVFLVNGFAPNLLRMYTRPESVIVVFSIHGMLSWSETRTNFVGVSDPARAIDGSLRREFFVRRSALRMRDLRFGANGVHLSAGPVEALLELQRFTAASMSQAKRALTDFQFGRKLARVFEAEKIEAILSNPLVSVNGKPRSVFDLTEEMDEDQAVEVLLLMMGRRSVPGHEGKVEVFIKQT